MTPRRSGRPFLLPYGSFILIPRLRDRRVRELILSTPLWEFRTYGWCIDRARNPNFLLPYGSFADEARLLINELYTFYSLMGVSVHSYFIGV